MTGGAGYDEPYCVVVFFSTVPLLKCVVVEVVSFAGSVMTGVVTTGAATTTAGGGVTSA
jgi:hypothetical protein